MAIKFNKTQLTPEKEFDKHIYHRDQFAHYLRWTHVINKARIGDSILDLGCGTGEWTREALEVELQKYFIIENKYGTFASQTDYKDEMNEWQKNMYDALKEYYDCYFLSCIMAPLFPNHSRNILWELRVK